MIRWRGDRVHILMLPDSLSREITAYADFNQRSFTAEITSTLEEKYTGQISAEARLSVLNSLLWSLERDAGPDVVNSSVYQVIRQIRDSLKDRHNLE